MLEFSWESFIFAIANFFILAALLFWLLHKPLLTVLAKRKQGIADTQQSASEAQKNADALKQDYEKKLSELAVDRDRVLAEARKKAEESGTELQAEARADAERDVADLRKAFEQEAADALRELQADIATTSVEMARGILSETTGEDLDRRLTAKLHEQLQAHAPADGQAGIAGSGDLPVRVISAREPDADSRNRTTELVNAIAGPGTEVSFETDPTLVAGARVEFCSLAVDATVAGILAGIRERVDELSSEAPGDAAS